MKNVLLGFCVLLAAFFMACTPKQAAQNSANQQTAQVLPNEVVKTFVELSASAKSIEDKRKLQDQCAGELRRAFERMSDEEFRLSYLATQVKIQGLKILESNIQNDSARVRYELSVENHQGTDVTHEVNEREVELIRSQGSWFIEFIRLKGSDKLAFTRGMIF